MEIKIKAVYIGLSEKAYEMDGRKGVSIKAKTGSLDGSGETYAWKIKEANHALQKKVSEIPPYAPVGLTLKMVSVKDEAKLELIDMVVTKWIQK